MSFSYSVSRILEIVGSGSTCEGAYDGAITGIASLAEAQAGDLSFLGNKKYRKDVPSSAASVLFLPNDFEGDAPGPDQVFVRVENPSFALALVCRDIEVSLAPKPAPGIHPSAVIDEGVQVDAGATIGPFCHIGEGARIGNCILEGHVSVGRHAVIGDETKVFPGVVIADYCEIGARNRLHAGCVIGSDGFGYEYVDGTHQRVPQVGRVVTEADVDIGANTTIDRARFGETRIGAGSKLDNLVQVGHNVQIGQYCLIVSQVGISGSTVLGNGVIVAGQAGFAGHLEVGDGAIIGARSGVAGSIEAGAKVRGEPPIPIALANRISILQQKLPDLFKRFSKLEKSVDALTRDVPEK